MEVLRLGQGTPAGKWVKATTQSPSGPRFQILAGLDGAALYESSGGDSLELGAGQFVLLPAALGDYTLSATGPTQVLRFLGPG